MLAKLYDKAHNYIGMIEAEDARITEEIKKIENTLTFKASIQTKIENEYYIETKDDEYVIREIAPASGEKQEIIATSNVDDLETKAWKSFGIEDAKIDDAARLALAGTGWTVKECTVAKKRNAGMLHVTTKEILEKLCTVFMCEIKADTKEKTVSFYAKRGEDKGTYFIRGVNLKKAKKRSTSYDLYTRIIPYGADGLTIESVNGGANYIDNTQYTEKVRSYIWQDESYTDAQTLKDDAVEKLDDLSKPYKAYTVDIIDLAKQNPEYSVLSFGLGDYVTLIDSETKIFDKQRIVKLDKYPDNPDKNTCDVANTTLSFEELQRQYQEAAEIVNTVVNGDGRYTGTIKVSDILKFEQGISESETVAEIKGKTAGIEVEIAEVKLKVGTIEANYISTEQADIKYATITNLNATNAEIQNLKANYIEADSLITKELSAQKAIIDDLTVKKIDADIADVKYATIDLANIQLGCITNAMLGTGIVNTAQIADGSITDAKIVDLTANKINAGTLSVERLEIRGSQNSLIYQINNISGALQSINTERINGETLTDRTITADKIVANAITANEIASKTITANEIVAGTITANEISANAITAGKIAAGAVTADKIASRSITAEKIEAKSITANEINTDNLFAQNIQATGTITGIKIIGASGDFNGNVTTANIIASGGKVGGWYLSKTRIKSSDGIYMGSKEQGVILCNENERPFFYAQDGNGICVYELRRDGTMKSTKAEIKGTIDATSIKIKDAISLYGNSISDKKILRIKKDGTQTVDWLAMGEGIYGIEIRNQYGLLADAYKNNGEKAYWSIYGDTYISENVLCNKELDVNGNATFYAKVFISGALYTDDAYSSTTTGAANLRACTPASGSEWARLARTTSSSKRYKNIIRDVGNEEIEKLFAIPVKWYTYKAGYLEKEDERYGIMIPGFVAEEMEAIMPIAIDHNADGSAEMWNVNIVVPLMFQMIKSNRNRLEDIAQMQNQSIADIVMTLAQLKELQEQLNQLREAITKMKQQENKG